MLVAGARRLRRSILSGLRGGVFPSEKFPVLLHPTRPLSSPSRSLFPSRWLATFASVPAASMSTLSVSACTTPLSDVAEGTVVQFVFDDELDQFKMPPGQREDFQAKPGQVLVLYSHASFRTQRALLVGLGSRDKASLKTVRKAVHVAVSRAKELKQDRLTLSLVSLKELQPATVAEAMATVAVLSDHAFDRYVSDLERKFHLKSVVISTGSDVGSGVATGTVIGQETCFTRNIANTRGDLANPAYMEKICHETAAELGNVSIRVVDTEELKSNGMNLFYNVGKAASAGPRLVVFEYNGNPSSQDKVVILGKGICFDTGGLNLKPTGSIESMYLDKHGSCTAIGVLRAVARLKLQVNVVAAGAFAENSIDSNAYKPYEILTSMKGTTVSIQNTDAEGRLVLADSMTWLQKNYSGITSFVDLATLTGAMAISLSEYFAGAFSNSDSLIAELQDAASRSHEKIWRMPLSEEYAEELKGKECDLHSTGKGRYGGACTAAAFLQHFMEPSVNWCHIDIAGTGMASAPRDFVCANGTGWGVDLLTKWLIARQN